MFSQWVFVLHEKTAIKEATLFCRNITDGQCLMKCVVNSMANHIASLPLRLDQSTLILALEGMKIGQVGSMWGAGRWWIINL